MVRKYSHISEDGQKLFQPEKETVASAPAAASRSMRARRTSPVRDRACQFVMWKNDRFWTTHRKEITRKMAADF